MKFLTRACLTLLLVLATLVPATLPTFAQTAPAAQPEAILHPAESAKLLPGAVFFRGQSATTQARNSGGVRFADGFYVLTTIVDNSGYSTGIQEKYQAYFITEVALDIDGHHLIPGAYGVGILKNPTAPQFVVMDIGAHDLFTATAVSDGKLRRPMPLQLIDGDTPGKYRLYFGRNYVEFERAK